MSYGQSLLKTYIDIMCPYEYLEDYRPTWLYGMELDFYFPDKKIAIEFNGDQHYIHTEFGEHLAQARRDKIKAQICKERGIKLRVLDASDLEYMRLRGRLGAIFKKESLKDATKVRKLRALNIECTAYRGTLIKNWDSPTSHRSYSKIRSRKIKERS